LNRRGRGEAEEIIGSGPDDVERVGVGDRMGCEIRADLGAGSGRDAVR